MYACERDPLERDPELQEQPHLGLQVAVARVLRFTRLLFLYDGILTTSRRDSMRPNAPCTVHRLVQPNVLVNVSSMGVLQNTKRDPKIHRGQQGSFSTPSSRGRGSLRRGRHRGTS